MIIVGEFTGAFIGGHGAAYSLTKINDFAPIVIGEPIGATCGTILMGKLFKQDGSAKGALIGSVIGTAVGLGGLYLIEIDNEEYGDGFVIGFALAMISPSVGSVIGYNIK